MVSLSAGGETTAAQSLSLDVYKETKETLLNTLPGREAKTEVRVLPFMCALRFSGPLQQPATGILGRALGWLKAKVWSGENEQQSIQTADETVEFACEASIEALDRELRDRYALKRFNMRRPGFTGPLNTHGLRTWVGALTPDKSLVIIVEVEKPASLSEFREMVHTTQMSTFERPAAEQKTTVPEWPSPVPDQNSEVLQKIQLHPEFVSCKLGATPHLLRVAQRLWPEGKLPEESSASQQGQDRDVSGIGFLRLQSPAIRSPWSELRELMTFNRVVAAVGPSGAGKSRTLLDLCREKYAVLLTAPSDFNLLLAEIGTIITRWGGGAFNNDNYATYATEVDDAIKDFLCAHLSVHFCYYFAGATPAHWLNVQLSSHVSADTVFQALRSGALPRKDAQSFLAAAPRAPLLIDEAQVLLAELSQAFVKPSVMDNNRLTPRKFLTNKGIVPAYRGSFLSQFTFCLSGFSLPLVLAGTALRLKHVSTIRSGLGKLEEEVGVFKQWTFYDLPQVVQFCKQIFGDEIAGIPEDEINATAYYLQGRPRWTARFCAGVIRAARTNGTSIADAFRRQHTEFYRYEVEDLSEGTARSNWESLLGKWAPQTVSAFNDPNQVPQQFVLFDLLLQMMLSTFEARADRLVPTAHFLTNSEYDAVGTGFACFSPHSVSHARVTIAASVSYVSFMREIYKLCHVQHSLCTC